ncbi:potassium/proton antiporter [Agilicoccus flavus]|uniref:potassium/proton antiporter n=1 Tax=Agilicoccus flavus TaxID=2775968 RepID=UPI001CF6D015|nr:potassium/proton antiporter [Agilicoccus flavus]
MGDVAAGFTIHDLDVVLAVGAAVVIVAVAAVRLSARTGLPSLLLYLLIGVLLGEAGLGIQFESMNLSRVLGYVALILILAEGGLTTSWSAIKSAVAPAAMLATVGVAVSIVVLGAIAHVLLGLDWQTAMLVAAILSSTDAAAVFSVLRDVRPSPRLAGILEAESGFNDAPVVLVVVALSTSLAPGVQAEPIPEVVALVAAELVGGTLVGLGVGYVAVRLMRNLGSTASGLFPIGVIAWLVLAYAVAALAHSSGFIAVYLAGLVIGNAALPHRTTTRGFAQALGWFAQIGLFVMLGLLATPSELLPQLVPAVLLGLGLLLIARPASVIVTMTPFRVPWREQAFLSWAGLRGAVPIVLATVPVITGVRGVEWIFNLVFVLVVVFTLVQAPTLPLVARLLRLSDPEQAVNLDIEATPLDEVGVELLEVKVGADSRLHGVEVFELRLPPGSDVSLVVRDEEAFVPSPHTVLRRGDQLLLVVPRASRAAAEQRLHAVDESGRLSGWSAGRSRDVSARRPPPGPA